MSDRDELVELCWNAAGYESSKYEVEEAADLILAAGWTKPCTVTTQRDLLRKQIAKDILNAVAHKAMTIQADGGETALLMAELFIKRMETVLFTPGADQ